jgi:hypothetical protein
MQAAQLQATLAKINKRFGAGTVSSFGQRTTFPDMCASPLAARLGQALDQRHAWSKRPGNTVRELE